MVATVRTSTLLAPSAVRLSPLSAPRVFPRPQQARVSRLRAEPEVRAAARWVSGATAVERLRRALTGVVLVADGQHRRSGPAGAPRKCRGGAEAVQGDA